MAIDSSSSSPKSIIGLGAQVVTSLPGQFLALLCINVVFVLGILWFLEKQQELATKVAVDVFDKCIAGALSPAPK